MQTAHSLLRRRLQSYIGNLAIGPLRGRLRYLGCHDCSVWRISERVCDEKRIAPYLFNFVVSKVGCIASRNDVLNKGNINGFIKQQGGLNLGSGNPIEQRIVVLSSSLYFFYDFSGNL